MYIRLWALIILMIPTVAFGAFDRCIGVYVGRITVDNQVGVGKAVLMSSPESTSGSYWVSFAGWEASAKKDALAVLMAAKLSGHRVDVYTTAADGCSIGNPGQVFKEIHLSTNP